MPSTRPLVAALCALLATLCCGLVAVAAPAEAAVSRAQAERAALTALGARRGSAPLIVFRDGRPLKPGTLITVAGLERLPRQTRGSGARAARSRDDLLRAAGVSVVEAPRVARVGREPVWFFYADEQPFAAYQHPGRIALVGQRSGRVTVSRRFSWPPLLDGRLPYFLRSYAGYRNPRARAFTRLWRPARPKAKAGPAAVGAASAAVASAGAAATAGSAANPLGAVAAIAIGPRAPGAAAAAAATRAVSTLRASNGTPAERRTAAALAAERSCVVRVGDTLGNFFDAASFDRTRARFGDFFNALARYDGRFVSARYRVATGTTLQRYVERLVTDRGCADVLLYVAGGGYVNGGEPAITVGVQGRRDGRVEQQVVTAATLRAIVGANPSVTFKLLLDAPGSGGFLKPLAGLPNLLIALTSSQAGQGSFTALPDLVAADGSKLPNRYNRGGLLEFSNRGLTGLRCFVADAAEVDGAIAAKERGLTRSFLAWMLRRAYALCGEGSLAEVVDSAPSPVLETHGFTAVPPDELPPGEQPAPPGPKNAAPTAAPVAVATAEDTPVPVALAGADPDGDMLTYAVGTPTSGAVTGEGAARTFTPAADFNGTATFDYTVADGRGGTATATVTVTVTPVDDPPLLDAGAGTTAWAEDDPPAAVAPLLTVRDVDDEQLDGATVTLSAGYETGADRLSLTAAGGITATWDAASGTLRLSGAATVAAYEAALRRVAFDNSSQTPSEAPRTVTFVVTGHGVSSSPSTRALTVADRNELPQLGGADTTRTFTEGDAAPVALFPSLTVADADDTALTGATVAIGAGFSAGEDELTFTDQSGISGSWNAATGVLRLTGGASLAAYQAALRTVGYRDTRAEDPTPGDRAVALRVTDGRDDSAAEQTTVTVVAVNDAPVLGGGGSTAAFTEDGPAVVALPNLTVSDVDDARLASATVTVGGGFSAGEDVLDFTDQNGISGSWSGATGVLTLTGSASLADYQAALRSVRYRDVSEDPSTVTRGLTVEVDDGEASSNSATASVTVTAVNDLPAVTAGGGSPTYSEGDATGVVVDPAITVTDPDDAELSIATVTISAGFDGGGDELTFSDTSAVVGSWNGLTGVLTLAGPATAAEFQAALRTVGFRSTSADPAPGPRTVSFTVSDATGAGAAATTTVAFDLVDDAPTVATSAGQTVWAGADVALDAALTVSDPDSARLTGATVTVSGGYRAAEDELTFTDQAGIAGAWDALTGTLTLSGDAPIADWQAALRTVAYRHNGALVDDATRTVTFAVENARRSAGATKQLVFGDPPAIDLPSGGLAYTENDPATAIDGALTVTDPDGGELTGATVALTSGFAAGEDQLSATTSGTAITASYSAGTLTLSGSDTLAHYQQVLRTVAYRNASDDPATAPRTAEFTVTDGLLSAADSTTVTVTAVNDAPVVTTSGGTADYTEDDTAWVAVDPAVSVTDVDDGQLTGATVRVTANLAPGEDLLTFTPDGEIAGAYVAETGTLTLSGTATVAAYQAALRTVRYANADTLDPSTAVRTVSITVTDGTTASAAATRNVTVRAVDDAPVVSSTDSLDYREDDAPTAIVPTLTVTDGDSAQLVGARVEVSANFRAAEDMVTFVNQNGITGSYNAATGRLTLTGSATVAQYQAALRSVTYFNSSQDPSEAERSVTITVDDGQLDSDAVVRPITVRAVNDAPVVPQTTVRAVGNTPLHYGTAAPSGRPALVVSGASANVLAAVTDVDGPGPPRVDVAASPTMGDRGGSVAWNADGTFTYRPAADVGDTETLTFYVTDQGSPAASARATVSVAVGPRVVYVDNSAAPGGDGRSESPFDTLAQAAAAADRAGDTIYLFNGDGTTTGMSGGVTLRANQRLLGERQPLSVDGFDLAPARTSVRPQLVGPVTLRTGNTVAGLTVVGDAGGTAAAVQGNATAADGTLRDLVLDGRAGGGLALDATTGSWTVTDVTARASGGGTALLVNRAGTVAFGGTNSVTAQAGGGVAVTGTTTSGTIGAVTVTSSGGHTGIALSGNGGSLSIPSVAVDTAGPGITIADSEGVSIGSVAGSSVTAGGAAVTTSQTRTLAVPPTIALATASSTGGAHGIQLGAGGTGSGGSFRALGGSLSGHTTAELAVDGGPTTVEYGGTIGDGTGLSARIANRSAGTVSVTGTIADGADAGGGIQLSGSSGGSTSFSGSSVTLDTGASPALSLAYTGAHAVTVSGRLDVDTTTGAGVSATGSSAGTLALTGSGSTLTSTGGGTALSLNGPQIASGGLTFRSIDQAGGGNAIVLANPGSAGGLTVTGSPAGSPTAGSGGTLTGQSGDAVRLTNASNVRFAAVAIRNASGSGIAADGLTGFALTDASAVTGNGSGSGGTGSGLSLRRLAGTVTISGANVSDNAFRNLDVVASGGTLDADVVGGTYSGTARSATGDDGIHVEAESGTPNVDLSGLTLSNNRGDHVQFTSSSGSTANATMALGSSTLSNPVGTAGGGVVVNPGGDNATWTVDVAGNTITGARNEAITVDTPGSGTSQTVGLRTLLAGNTIGSAGVVGSGSGTGAGIGIRSNGGASVVALVSGNVVRRYATAGMTLVQNDGSGRLDVTAWNNRFNEPDVTGLPVDGIAATAGGAGATDTGRLCLDLGRTAPNDVGSASAVGGYGISVRQRDQATIAIPGFAGAPTDYAAVTALLQQRNTVGSAPSALVTGIGGGPGFVNGSPNCAQ